MWVRPAATRDNLRERWLLMSAKWIRSAISTFRVDMNRSHSNVGRCWTAWGEGTHDVSCPIMKAEVIRVGFVVGTGDFQLLLTSQVAKIGCFLFPWFNRNNTNLQWKAVYFVFVAVFFPYQFENLPFLNNHMIACTEVLFFYSQLIFTVISNYFLTHCAQTTREQFFVF